MRVDMDDPINYVVPRFGTSPGPISKALSFAESLAQGSHTPKDIAFLCHAKHYLAKSTAEDALLRSLGRAALTKLLSGKRISLGPSATLRLESLSTIRKSTAPDIALVHNADARLLDSLLYFDRVEVVIAIAFTLSRIEEWISRENAVIPGTPISAAGALEDNHVAIEALWALTYMVDPLSAWVGPWQRDAAIEVLWSIYTRGCRPKPSEVKSWARLNGWSPDSAEGLRLLANEVAQNRAYPREPGFYWWPDTFKVLSSLASLRREGERGINRR